MDKDCESSPGVDVVWRCRHYRRMFTRNLKRNAKPLPAINKPGKHRMRR